MGANFLDILKAFDKVWPEGLLFKLELIGISGNFLSLLKSFLSNRFQQVVLNGQCSSWSSVLVGVPQGSILRPLLFLLIYIHDLPENLQSTVKLFADDTSLFSAVYEPNISASQLESDLKKNSHWAYKWKMNFNPELSKHLGLYLDEKLNFYGHINAKILNANKEIEIIKGFRIPFPESPF